MGIYKIFALHTRVSGAFEEGHSFGAEVARQWPVGIINYQWGKKEGTTATRSGNRGELRFRVKYEILLSTS